MMSNERSPILPTAASRESKKESSSRYAFFVASSIAAVVGLLHYANTHHMGVARTGPTTQLMGSSQQTLTIRPGSIFIDNRGEPINAHGAGFLFFEGVYYWYGEIKSGPTDLPAANADWGGTRVDLTGISCYSSKDLLNWKYHGNILPAVVDDINHDLYIGNVAERPKVVFNAKSGKFVMWLHVDSLDYSKARCGVATSDNPEGPFEYLGSFRPNKQMARDLTVFVDDDERAYLFTSSEDNAAMHISQLSDDYISTTGNYSRIFVGRFMEAPTVFKKSGKYYFIGSRCTAWKPNAARSAVASSIWGPWVELGNPCIGDDANTTFHSQLTYALPLGSGRFMLAADRWVEKNLSDSRYIWLPISFDEDNGNPIIRWRDEWSPGVWPT